MTDGDWDEFIRLASVVVDDLATRFGVLPSGAWDTPPAAAWIVPLTQANKIRSLNFGAGNQSYRAFEPSTEDFATSGRKRGNRDRQCV